MRRGHVLLILSAASACGWSCTLLTDFGGLAGEGLVDGPALEAGAGDAVDAAPTHDGALDAAEAAAQEAGCARRVDASFCVDFEEADPIGLGTWSAVDNGNGKGVIKLTQDASTSPPNAVSLQAVSTANCYNVVLRKSFSGAVSGAKVIVALRSDGDVQPIGWELNNGGPSYSIVGQVSSNQIALHLQRYTVDAGTTELAYVTAPLATSPFNEWTDVEVSFDSTPARKARIRVGSVQVTADVPSEMPFANPNLALGQWCAAAGRTILADDVGVWITP